MRYIKSKKDILDEGEGAGAVGAGDAGGAVGAEGAESAVPMQDCPSMSQVAIDTEKVLGKCDHKHDGYMGKNCFHIPKKVMPTLHRWELCNGGSKRKKGKNGKDKKYAYEKGMKVITSYNDLVESLNEDVKPVFVFNIPHAKIEEICSQDENDNPRFNKNQLLKYIGLDAVEFVGLFMRDDMKTCLAIAALSYGLASMGSFPDDCYVNEIQSFKKGYGEALLKRILESQERVWLCANPEAPKTLVEFYKRPSFGLNEYVVEKSKWKDGAPAHFFYTDDCDEVALIEFIEANYSQDSISEGEDTFDSMMNAMNQSKKSAVDDIGFDVVPDDDAFTEVNADDIVNADSIFFSGDFEEKKTKHIYTLNVTSMNNDTSLDFNDTIMSDKPMSFRELVDWFWPRLPAGYGLQSKDFMQAGADYQKMIDDAKEDLVKNGSVEKLRKAAETPFPVICLAYGHSLRDNVKMTPVENEFDDMTQKGVPAALVLSDDDPQLKFNKYASDKIYANQVIGESKNKLTGHAKVIVQKKQSLKTTATSKPAKIQKTTMKKDQKDAMEISQSIRHVKKVSRPLSKKMMSSASQQETKHSRKVPEIKSFSKPKLEVKSITFPSDEVKDLEGKNTIVTSRVSDDYDKFQLGDIVKAPQIRGKTFKIISCLHISDITHHPFMDKLTDKQVAELSKHDKISVLMLSAQDE